MISTFFHRHQAQMIHVSTQLTVTSFLIGPVEIRGSSGTFNTGTFEKKMKTWTWRYRSNNRRGQRVASHLHDVVFDGLVMPSGSSDIFDELIQLGGGVGHHLWSNVDGAPATWHAWAGVAHQRCWLTHPAGRRGGNSPHVLGAEHQLVDALQSVGDLWEVGELCNPLHELHLRTRRTETLESLDADGNI